MAKKQGNSARRRLVLSIVDTDLSFSMVRINENDSVWIGRCIHCNRRLGVSPDGNTDATVEHIVPRCAGGSESDPRNLALACGSCNNEKGIRHDKKVGRGGRADEVVKGLVGRRLSRWREPGALSEGCGQR